MVVVIEKLRLQNKLVVTTTSPLKDAKNTAQAIYTIAFLNNLTFTMYLKHKAEDNTKQKKNRNFFALYALKIVFCKSYSYEKMAK